MNDFADEIRLPSFMRNLRHFPPGSLVEVTTRTIQARPLLTPSRLLNRIIVGVLGRAQRRYPVRIHSYAFALPPDTGRTMSQPVRGLQPRLLDA